jgi:hypothetical protein
VRLVAGEIKRALDVVSNLLVKEFGFAKSGHFFLRTDDLLRSAVVTRSKTSIPGSYRFDVSLNLGIIGLSSSSARSSEWVVAASLDKINRMRRGTTRRFEITGILDQDSRVELELADVLSSVCDEFLLGVDGPAELVDLVLNGQREFSRLDLWPWNELGRLELACVYLEFMGERRAVDQLQEKAIQMASANGVDYFPDKLRKNILMASGKRASI